jgi:hypothetical protein
MPNANVGDLVTSRTFAGLLSEGFCDGDVLCEIPRGIMTRLKIGGADVRNPTAPLRIAKGQKFSGAHLNPDLFRFAAVID